MISTPRRRRAYPLVVVGLLGLLTALLPRSAAAQEAGRPASDSSPSASDASAGSGDQFVPSPQPEANKGFWATFAHTTPFGISTKTPGEAGAWGRTMDGVKRIWSEGRSTVIVSGYAWHTPWKHKTERQKAFNDAAWGGGFGRVYGENDRRLRLLYVFANDDSHDKMQYMAGYAWLARYHPYGTLQLGVGYQLFLIGRHEYYYIPGPLILPVFSVGTDAIEVFSTYVPYGEVALFVGRITF
jgi:palmitoyl transferase